MPRENEVEVAAQEVIVETQFPGALREARRFNPLVWKIRIIPLNGEIFEISVDAGPIESIKTQMRRELTEWHLERTLGSHDDLFATPLTRELFQQILKTCDYHHRRDAAQKHDSPSDSR